MVTNRMAGDIAPGCYTCKLDDLRKNSIDLCFAIKFFAAPSGGEITPLHQRPSGVADLVERAVRAVMGRPYSEGGGAYAIQRSKKAFGHSLEGVLNPGVEGACI